jgi:hypothetical protein
MANFSQTKSTVFPLNTTKTTASTASFKRLTRYITGFRILLQEKTAIKLWT